VACARHKNGYTVGIPVPVIDLLNGATARHDSSAGSHLVDELTGRPGWRIHGSVRTESKPIVQAHESVAAWVVRLIVGASDETVQRRWATVPVVIDDIVQSGPARTSPLPDTGSLRGDVASYAAGVADTLAGPLGVLVLRAAMSNVRGAGPSSLLLERKPQLQQMLDRARTRGEHPPTVDELLELVIAPLYFQALFGQPMAAADVQRLLDRLHTLHP
jgi:hypothetical protein